MCVCVCVANSQFLFCQTNKNKNKNKTLIDLSHVTLWPKYNTKAMLHTIVVPCYKLCITCPYILFTHLLFTTRKCPSFVSFFWFVNFVCTCVHFVCISKHNLIYQTYKHTNIQTYKHINVGV